MKDKNFAALLAEYTAACVDYGRISKIHEYLGTEAENMEKQRRYIEKLGERIEGMIPPNLLEDSAKNAA